MRHPRHKAPGPFPLRTSRFSGLLLALLAGLLAGPDPAFGAPQEPEQGEPPRQEQESPRFEQIAEIYEVQHAPVEQLSSLIRIFTVVANANPELGVIGLRGQKADVLAALAALRRLDVPAAPTRAVEVTLYVLLGSKQANGQGVPSHLEAVTEQLKGSLGYESFELLDAVVARTRDQGRLENEGMFSSDKLPMPVAYSFSVGPVAILTQEDKTVVRLNKLRFAFTPILDGQAAPQGTRLGTDVEVAAGQKVVVGKATADSLDRGVILVLEVAVE